MKSIFVTSLITFVIMSSCASANSETANLKSQSNDPVADALSQYAQHIDEARSKNQARKTITTLKLQRTGV